MQTLEEFLEPPAKQGLVTLDEFCAPLPTLDEFVGDIHQEEGTSAKHAKTEVYLYMYDVSDGLASKWTCLKGIWHTGIVVCWPSKFPSAGTQYWLGKEVYVSWAEMTAYHEPVEKRLLGYTSRSCAGTLEFVKRQQAKPRAYDLLHIPDDVLKQPQEALRLYPLLTRLLSRWDMWLRARATAGGGAGSVGSR